MNLAATVQVLSDAGVKFIIVRELESPLDAAEPE